MNVADKIDKFLEEYEIENIEGSDTDLKSLLIEASKEIKNLTHDGELLLWEINNKNHNASLMRAEIAKLKAGKK